MAAILDLSDFCINNGLTFNVDEHAFLSPDSFTTIEISFVIDTFD
jgi:hypothetical protein